jgi:hypothetical protein
MLIALGLIYALLYAAWLRKKSRHASAAEAVRGLGAAQGPTPAAVSQVVAEGTYVSTTTATSRLERVTVEGLGNRAKATLTVTRGDPDQLVRIDRQGESAVVIQTGRLTAVRRDRGMAGKFLGAKRLLVLQWKSSDGEVYETGFLPRYRADLDAIESAVWWHTDSTDSTASTASTDSTATDDLNSPESGKDTP